MTTRKSSKPVWSLLVSYSVDQPKQRAAPVYSILNLVLVEKKEKNREEKRINNQHK